MNRQFSFEDLRPHAKRDQARIFDDRTPISLLLDHVNDKQNLGLIFRLADGARLDRIYLYNQSGFEPDGRIRRISRNTVSLNRWTVLKEPTEVTKVLQQYHAVALEYTTQSLVYTQFRTERPVLLCIGNEVSGLRQSILDRVEDSIHLPMLGMKTSLNVAMATAVAVYGLLNNVRPV